MAGFSGCIDARPRSLFSHTAKRRMISPPERRSLLKRSTRMRRIHREDQMKVASMKLSRGRRILAATTAFISIILFSPGTASAVAAAPDEAACRRNLPAAEGLTGHSITRFDWCRIYDFWAPINDVATGQPVAMFGGLVTIYGTADRSARTASFTINLRDVVVTASQDKSYIGISTTCTAVSNVTCSGATNIEQSIDDWQDNANTSYTVTVTSPNETGIAPYFITNTQVLTHLQFGVRDGRTIPGGGDFSLANVRFDSAMGAIGYASYHGTVFPDNVPELVLNAAAGSPYRQEALHVYDAIHRTTRTFPSFLGKFPPTRLSRYMGPLDNNAVAKQVCIDVWGPDYAKPPGAPANDPNRRECDEYPFASTYQGARLSTTTHEYPTGNWRNWHGSARPIHWEHNNKGGRALLEFYGANRMLDGDAFDVSATL
jgi:hypothetical protein